MGARYYDPTVGAFLTRDTELGQSPYAYCGGDPVNFSDPSGHSASGYYGAFPAVTLTVTVVVVFAPVEGPIFLGAAIGIVVLAGVAALGGYGGDVLSDKVDEGNRERDQRVKDDENLPEKAGIGVSAGDSNVTEGEASGGSTSRSGDYSKPAPTMYDDYDGTTNQQIAGPYAGPPHYGPKP